MQLIANAVRRTAVRMLALSFASSLAQWPRFFPGAFSAAECDAIAQLFLESSATAEIDERTSELDRKVIAHNIEKLSRAGDTADNHAISMCKAWRGGMKLPYNFDARCFGAACLAVNGLPTEVRLIILKRLFIGPTEFVL